MEKPSSPQHPQINEIIPQTAPLEGNRVKGKGVVVMVLLNTQGYIIKRLKGLLDQAYDSNGILEGECGNCRVNHQWINIEKPP